MYVLDVFVVSCFCLKWLIGFKFREIINIILLCNVNMF